MEKKILNLKMKPELYAKVAEYSKREVRTVTNSINYIISRFFNEEASTSTEGSEEHREQE